MGDASTLAGNSLARRDLTRIFAAAVSAVAPAHLIARALAGELAGAEKVPALLADASRIFLLAAGKAALGMATALAARLGPKVHDALAIIPSPPAAGGSGTQIASSDIANETIRVIAAAHPLPDASSERAGAAALEFASRAGPGDLLLLALSGGASALMAAPADPVTLADKIAINAALLGSGASIRELNVVRRHISAIKGGGLLRACGGARVLSLILSDVARNDLATIASGPTAADPTSFTDAVGVLKRRRLWGRAPEAIRERLERGAAGEIAETLKPDDPLLARVDNLVIGDNGIAVEAAAAAAAAAGYTVDRWRELYGEADDLGRALSAHLSAIASSAGAHVCVVAGGEPVVTIRGRGRGGRAQQAALAMALELTRLGREHRILALFAGTDGIDGPTEAAGAFVSPRTAERAREAGFDAAAALARNDAYPLFAGLGDLLITGPTGTNVSDIFIGLVNY
ncbi:MAG: glycerate kinase type-2 family protein [Candidatus Binataceae bacterium]